MGYPVDADIKNGQYKKVYLLCGEESYLVRFYARKLHRALISEDDEMNLNVFQGTDISTDEVIRLADTMPFFAEHRLIILDGTGLFARGGQELAEYLPSMPDSTVMLFLEEGKVDERGKLFKTVKSLGTVQQMKHPDEAALGKWIVKALDRSGKRITQPALDLLLGSVGHDMQLLHTEVEKLIAYTGDRSGIQTEDVRTIVSVQVENRIFAMVEAIAGGNSASALSMLQDLLQLKEAPPGILTLMMNQFNLMYQVRDLREQGFDSASIYQKVGMQQFRVRKALQQSEGLSPRCLKKMLEACVMAFQSITTGRMDPESAVQLAVVSCSRLAEKR